MARPCLTYTYRPTRYYLGRLWKITWSATCIGRHRLRVVKHYEHRTAPGQPWTYVRGIASEMLY